jgi:anti-sigma regulatory factor (Ser/Thr protein kinase)
MSPAIHEQFISDPAAVAGVRRRIEEFAQRHGFSESAANDIGLCVNEAITNIIRHAYDGQNNQPITFEAQFDGGETGPLVMTLRDWGNGRIPDLKRPDPDPAALKPGGLGIPCLKRLLDGVEFIRQPDGMLLKMVRRRR